VPFIGVIEETSNIQTLIESNTPKCQSYDKLCANYDFNISAFAGFIVWIIF
jgi:hypothetical protein